MADCDGSAALGGGGGEPVVALPVVPGNAREQVSFELSAGNCSLVLQR